MDERGPGLHRTALEMFGGLAKSYERTLDLATLVQDRYWKRWIADNAALSRGDRVLDIGAGTCLLEERLEGSGCEVMGLDLTEEMLSAGRDKKLGCVKLLVRGDAEYLPFREEAFDVVVSCYVPKYVELVAFAHEIARVLKDGGKVALYDFVRPGGPWLAVLALYLHGGMRIAGFLLSLAGNSAATTFRNLPRIVEGATWQERLPKLLARTGVRTVKNLKLTGGVVGAYSGKKSGESLT
ncbi:MAG: class I SAM-dependent methyltransferase [Thaumarchaeota archaeon]|nr:class I SAM-dependent methyltransferase [Nitrososphaerota archaeon]